MSEETWRIVTQKIELKDGSESIHTELVAPGYYTRRDKNVTERLAVPKEISGPFSIHNNGYGTLQILDGKYRMVGAIDFDIPKIITDQNVESEEALWLAQKIIKALNSKEG